jgi:hypothetical protein
MTDANLMSKMIGRGEKIKTFLDKLASNKSVHKSDMVVLKTIIKYYKTL